MGGKRDNKPASAREGQHTLRRESHPLEDLASPSHLFMSEPMAEECDRETECLMGLVAFQPSGLLDTPVYREYSFGRVECAMSMLERRDEDKVREEIESAKKHRDSR
jgi:hypothetical protein